MGDAVKIVLSGRELVEIFVAEVNRFPFGSALRGVRIARYEHTWVVTQLDIEEDAHPAIQWMVALVEARLRERYALWS